MLIPFGNNQLFRPRDEEKCGVDDIVLNHRGFAFFGYLKGFHSGIDDVFSQMSVRYNDHAVILPQRLVCGVTNLICGFFITVSEKGLEIV